MPVDPRVSKLLEKAKELAAKYRALTDKPLGVTGEVGEYEAARILGLELTGARNPGYDATEVREGRLRKLQIKTRSIPRGNKRSQKLGQINRTQDWDAILMVLLDENLDAAAIYEADRATVLEALEKTHSKARKRGALAISEFKSLSKQRWFPPGGAVS